MLHLFTIILILATSLKSDMLPNLYNYKPMLRTVMITNVHAYPEIVLLSCHTSSIEYGHDSTTCRKIDENSSIEDSYHGLSYILTFPKKTFELYNGLKGIDFHQLSLKSRGLPKLPLYSGKVYIPINSPIQSETIHYKILSVKGNNVTLSLKQRILIYVAAPSKNLHPQIPIIKTEHMTFTIPFIKVPLIKPSEVPIPHTSEKNLPLWNYP